MKKIFLVVFFLMPVYAASEEKIDSITICTPEWESYSQQDGVGLYHDVWREVFGAAGIKIIIKYAPFIRCASSIEIKKLYDAFPGGYDSVPGLIPKWHIGVDWLTVAYKKGHIEKWEGQKTLTNKRVMWERGYKFDEAGVVTVPVKVHEYDSGNLTVALTMLVKDRVDFVIDYKPAIEKQMMDLKLTDALSTLPDIIKGPKYYMVFTDTYRGKKLSEIWDKGMERLNRSGKLKDIYQSYGNPTF